MREIRAKLEAILKAEWRHLLPVQLLSDGVSLRFGYWRRLPDSVLNVAAKHGIRLTENEFDDSEERRLFTYRVG